MDTNHGNVQIGWIIGVYILEHILCLAIKSNDTHGYYIDYANNANQYQIIFLIRILSPDNFDNLILVTLHLLTTLQDPHPQLSILDLLIANADNSWNPPFIGILDLVTKSFVR